VASPERFIATPDVRDGTEKVGNGPVSCAFLTFFRAKWPKYLSFFDFFSVFRFIFLHLVLSLRLGFLPFGRNVHISLLEFAVKTRLRS